VLIPALVHFSTLAAIAIFAQCIVIVAPSTGTPSNINEIYILHLVGYNSVTESMGSISIRLAVVAFQMYEIAQNSSKV